MDYQKRLLELRTKKAEALKGMEDIQEATAKENRKRTDEEKTKFDAFKKDATDFDGEIRDLEETIAIKAKSAKAVETEEERFNVNGSGDNGDFTKKDQKIIQKSFRMKHVLRAVGSKGKVSIEGLEKELHEEGLKECREAGVDYNPAAIVVPYKAMRLMKWNDAQMEQRTNLQATTATAGQEAIETDVIQDQYIQALRPQNVLLSAGTKMFSGLTNNIYFTKETAVFQPAWAATENAAASQNAGTFGSVLFSPKRLAGFFDVSNQLLVQAGWMETYLREQILLGIAEQFDIAGINGSGSSGVPPGILNTAGIGSEVGGANGLAPTRGNIVDMEQLVGTAGANLGKSAWVTNFKVGQYLKKTEFSSGSGRYLMDGAYLWNGQSGGVPQQGWLQPILEYYPVFRSAHVPSTLTKGTSAGICSAIIFGDFTQAAFGQWGGMQILVDPYTQATSGNTRYVVNVYADFHVLKTGAFAAQLDALTP